MNSFYGKSGYECVSGLPEQISLWVENKGWKEPLIVWDDPLQALPFKTVASSDLRKALQGASADVLIIFGDERTTDRANIVCRDIIDRKGELPFSTIVVPTSYSSTRSFSGRYLAEEGTYRFSPLLIPDLCVFDEDLLRSREPLECAIDAAALLAQIFDMFMSAETESYQWHLLQEAFRLFSRHAHEAITVRAATASKGASGNRNMLALASYLTGTCGNISPPGMLDACARAMTAHSDLTAEENIVLAFPYLAPTILESHRELYTEERKEMLQEMEALRTTLLSPYIKEIPKTLHSVSRPPFNRGTLSLSDISAIAEDVYNTMETVVALPERDHQTIIRWVEQMYWGYEGR